MSEPAFPHLHDSCQRNSETAMHAGISKRELFAAMAMQSVSCGIIAEANHGTSPLALDYAAVDMADALIAELSKEPRP